MRIVRRLINAFFNMQFRHKIALIIFLFTLIPMAFLGPYYVRKSWNSKIDELINRNRIQLLDRVETIHDLSNDSIKKIAFIINNNRLNSILTVSDEDDIEDVLSNYNVLNEIFGVLEMGNSQKNISIYTFNDLVYEGQYILKADRLDESLKNEILDSKGNSVIWKYRKLSDATQGEREYICLYKKIMSLDKPLAIVEVRIPISRVIQPLKFDIPKGGFILYFTKNGDNIIANSNNLKSEEISPVSSEYSRYGQCKDYYTINTELKSNNDRIVLFIPKNEILVNMTGYTVVIFIAIILSILLMTFLVELVSSFLTNRLSNLMKKIDDDVEKYISGEQLVPVDIIGNDEFGRIAARFNKLIQKIKEYYQATSEYELEKKTLEMDLLQACINPHFLYNTLSALKWSTSDEKLGRIIDSMVKYYRVVLSKGDKILKISREIDSLKQYLDIQKFAYKVEFQFSFEIDEGIEDYLIIKNLLQPIVENAFLHGVKRMGESGIIIVSAKLIGNKIVFEIADNGHGMEKETLKNLLNGNSTNLSSGYGMKNVQKRIESYYGNEYGLSVKSEINGGTIVTVVIPAIPDSHENLTLAE